MKALSRNNLRKSVLLGFFKVIGLLIVGLVIVFFLGPRPDTDQKVSFDSNSLGSDLDGYLEDAEKGIPALRAGKQKQIVWRDPESKARTEYALAYVHGFSASRVETSPVTENVAQALNANVFYTRLAGHGRDGAGLAEPKMSDWLDDIAEAIAIAQRIGDKTILITGSTGGTLATWAAAQAEFADKIDGIALISPNYGIQGASTGLINMPWAETILPALLGPERSFEPINEGHRDGWTHQYPSRAIFPMAALLRVVDEVDKSAIMVPAIFIYSSQDTVVVPAMTERAFENWGGPKTELTIETSDDPNHHVIAGDILSPSTTDEVSAAITEWASAL